MKVWNKVLLASFIGLLVAGCDDSSKVDANLDKAKDSAEQMKDAAQKKADDLTDKAKATADEIKKEAATQADQLKDKASAIKEDAAKQADAINFLCPIQHRRVTPLAHIGQNLADGTFQAQRFAENALDAFG